jgi:spore coat protein U-like protein
MLASPRMRMGRRHGGGGTATQTGTGAGKATASTFKVYGRFPDSAANQAAVPGTDTITVTVTY